jgi:hypothetical protein
MPIRDINKKYEFTQIPCQPSQAIIIPITHTNRQSQHITPVKLLNFAQSVAERKPIFPLSSRIIVPEVRCIFRPAECETSHLIELEHF